MPCATSPGVTGVTNNIEVLRCRPSTTACGWRSIAPSTGGTRFPVTAWERSLPSAILVKNGKRDLDGVVDNQMTVTWPAIYANRRPRRVLGDQQPARCRIVSYRTGVVMSATASCRRPCNIHHLRPPDRRPGRLPHARKIRPSPANLEDSGAGAREGSSAGQLPGSVQASPSPRTVSTSSVGGGAGVSFFPSGAGWEPAPAALWASEASTTMKITSSTSKTSIHGRDVHLRRVRFAPPIGHRHDLILPGALDT